MISEELYFETADLTNELLEKGSFFKKRTKIKHIARNTKPQITNSLYFIKHVSTFI